MEFEEFVDENFGGKLELPKFHKGGVVLPHQVIHAINDYTIPKDHYLLKGSLAKLQPNIIIIPNFKLKGMRLKFMVWKLRRKMKYAVKITQQ